MIGLFPVCYLLPKLGGTGTKAGARTVLRPFLPLFPGVALPAVEVLAPLSPANYISELPLNILGMNASGRTMEFTSV